MPVAQLNDTQLFYLELGTGLPCLIPRSELVVFEESAHLPFVEEPADFLDAVRDWLHRAR